MVGRRGEVDLELPRADDEVVTVIDNVVDMVVRAVMTGRREDSAHSGARQPHASRRRDELDVVGRSRVRGEAAQRGEQQQGAECHRSGSGGRRGGRRGRDDTERLVGCRCEGVSQHGVE